MLGTKTARLEASGKHEDFPSSLAAPGAPSKLDDLRIRQRADWGFGDDLPRFCKQILSYPQPFRKDCHRDSRNMTCKTAPYEVPMFSQFKQDYYFFTRHFSRLRRAGVYLDVAANDPVSISNTYFLDRCLGWRGVCVEANPAYFERIHRQRSCALVPTCVGSREGQTVEFALHGGAGAIVGESNKHAARWAKDGVQVPGIKQRCTTLQHTLDRVGVRVVDFLSLDVEGHELEVLRGVDWERTRVNVMSIEVSPGSVGGIETFLAGVGYRRHFPQLDEASTKRGLLQEDAVFLHADVEFGAPV